MVIANKIVVRDRRLEHVTRRTVAPLFRAWFSPLAAPMWSVVEVEVVLTRAGSMNPDDVQWLPIAFGEEIDIVRKSTRFGDAHILRGLSFAESSIEVYLAEPDPVGKARLKERQLKTSSVIALTVVVS